RQPVVSGTTRRPHRLPVSLPFRRYPAFASGGPAVSKVPTRLVLAGAGAGLLRRLRLLAMTRAA
ncbi:MAG TPA: hypothetical protein VJQ77_11380, partial [Novosphingobium sp.]|nr:hypothetical protein [Novosphingobium sp.]